MLICVSNALGEMEAAIEKAHQGILSCPCSNWLFIIFEVHIIAEDYLHRLDGSPCHSHQLFGTEKDLADRIGSIWSGGSMYRRG
jgi:hypothetical protein